MDIILAYQRLEKCDVAAEHALARRLGPLWACSLAPLLREAEVSEA